MTDGSFEMKYTRCIVGHIVKSVTDMAQELGGSQPAVGDTTGDRQAGRSTDAHSVWSKTPLAMQSVAGPLKVFQCMQV